MKNVKLEDILDDPKKVERYIRKELIKEYQKQLNEFILDRLFIQLNQE